MRDAGQQAAHRREFFALAKSLALALDLGLRHTPVGEIEHRSGVERAAIDERAPQHHLDRELAGIGAQRGPDRGKRIPERGRVQREKDEFL